MVRTCSLLSNRSECGLLPTTGDAALLPFCHQLRRLKVAQGSHPRPGPEMGASKQGRVLESSAGELLDLSKMVRRFGTLEGRSTR